MIHKIPLAVLASALLAIPAVPAAAQQAPEEGPSISARCLAFQIDGKVPPLFVHAVPLGEEPTEGVPVKVQTYLNHERQKIPVRTGNLVFTSDADPSSIDDPEKLFARFKVPGKMRSGILMFLPGSSKAGEPKYRILPIDDENKSFPRGSLKIVNISGEPFRLTLCDKKFDLRSGSTRVIEDPPVNEANASEMKAFTFDQGQWQRVGAGVWPHPGRKRVLQVAFINPESRRFEIRGIRDIAVRD